MPPKPRITKIDYNPPGNDVQGEHVVIRNVGDAAADLTGWTVRDAAPSRTHVFTFPQVTVAPGTEVRVWTKAGTATATDLFWGLTTAVWNNRGDTATLRDPSGTEVSRYRYVPIPAGAGPLELVVPAFWTREPKHDANWAGVRNAAGVVSVVVIEASWPSTAKADASWKAASQAHLDGLPGTILGYVSTRGPAPSFDLHTADEIMEGPNKADSVKAWYDEFGGQIDGIYFDELMIPEKLADMPAAMALVSRFKTERPGAKVMILAGQCPDAAVVGPDVDWALMWEDEWGPTKSAFTARSGTTLQAIPAWWKDPANRRKIVHVIHNCPEPDRQYALGLARERNAGHVHVMDERGKNSSGRAVLYDHLPPYWDAEVREADSYYDFGFDAKRFFLAAHRYGLSQAGVAHAWPNCEAAWYGADHVRGTYLMAQGPHTETRDVPLSTLGGPAPYDIPAVWRAAHEYAVAQGFATGIPAFEETGSGTGRTTRVVLVANQSWLQPATIPVTETYQQPTFAEPSAVVRNVHRWASSRGFETAIPTFVPDDPAPQGRRNHYKAFTLAKSSSPVTWADIATWKYIDEL